MKKVEFILNNKSIYPYINNSPLELRQSYAYSSYKGQDFLQAWQSTREKLKLPIQNLRSISRNLKIENQSKKLKIEIVTGKSIDTLSTLNHLNTVKNPIEYKYIYDFFIQRFEVSKRLFERYEITKTKPKSLGDYNLIEPYLLFSEILVKYLHQNLYLPALNSLLKVVDTLLGLHLKMSKEQKIRLSLVIDKEFFFIRSINPINKTKPSKNKKTNDKKNQEKYYFDLSKLIFIAADTARSKAYALALKNAGIKIETSILLQAKKTQWGQSKYLPNFNKKLRCGVFSKNLNIPLLGLLKDISDKLIVISSDSINCSKIKQAITTISPTFILFSGYGGEIVAVDELAPNIPILHIHSGNLPQYRGSTTVYYSILENNSCGASAIILNSEIDEGAILHKKIFSPPSENEDIDYYYDSFIRADVLVETIEKIHSNNGSINIENQSSSEGNSYYIIHPVLKHLSIMKTKKITPIF